MVLIVARSTVANVFAGRLMTQTEHVTDLHAGLLRAVDTRPAVTFLDAGIPGALGWIARFQGAAPLGAVIMLGDAASPSEIVEATRRGAFGWVDYSAPAAAAKARQAIDVCLLRTPPAMVVPDDLRDPSDLLH